MLFSERMGFEPAKIMQIDSIDSDLRESLFSVFRRLEERLSNFKSSYDYRKKIYSLIWCDFLYRPYDSIPLSTFTLIDSIKKAYDKLVWHKVYSYIEFYIQTMYSKYYLAEKYIDELKQNINDVLIKHNSGFRLLKQNIIPITNEIELYSIAEAAETGFDNVDTHMIAAIEEFSKRENIEYTNVVRHSILAVEAIAGNALNKDGSPLSNYIKRLKNNHKMHLHLANGIESLYFYASDKETATRHAGGKDAQHIPGFKEAKFMLVTCSAIVNFLKHEYLDKREG